MARRRTIWVSWPRSCFRTLTAGPSPTSAVCARWTCGTCPWSWPSASGWWKAGQRRLARPRPGTAWDGVEAVVTIGLMWRCSEIRPCNSWRRRAGGTWKCSRPSTASSWCATSRCWSAGTRAGPISPRARRSSWSSRPTAVRPGKPSPAGSPAVQRPLLLLGRFGPFQRPSLPSPRHLA